MRRTPRAAVRQSVCTGLTDSDEEGKPNGHQEITNGWMAAMERKLYRDKTHQQWFLQTHTRSSMTLSASHTQRHPASPCSESRSSHESLLTSAFDTRKPSRVWYRVLIKADYSFPKSGTLVVSQPTSVQNQTTPVRQTRTSKRVRARRHGEGFHSLVIDAPCCVAERAH